MKGKYGRWDIDQITYQVPISKKKYEVSTGSDATLVFIFLHQFQVTYATPSAQKQ